MLSICDLNSCCSTFMLSCTPTGMPPPPGGFRPVAPFQAGAEQPTHTHMQSTPTWQAPIYLRAQLCPLSHAASVAFFGIHALVFLSQPRTRVVSCIVSSTSDCSSAPQHPSMHPSMCAPCFHAPAVLCPGVPPPPAGSWAQGPSGGEGFPAGVPPPPMPGPGMPFPAAGSLSVSVSLPSA